MTQLENPKLKSFLHDTNHVPWCPAVCISSSSPWWPLPSAQPQQLLCTPIIGGSLPVPVPCAPLLGMANRWARLAKAELQHDSRAGTQSRVQLCLSPPKHFPFFSPLPLKGSCQHYIAFHDLNMKESPGVDAWQYRMKHRHKSRLVLA